MILTGGTDKDNVNYVNNNQRENPYFNTYNPGRRDHPKFSYKNNRLQFVENPTPSCSLGFQGHMGDNTHVKFNM